MAAILTIARVCEPSGELHMMGLRDVRLADAGRTDQQDVLLLVDEVARREMMTFA